MAINSVPPERVNNRSKATYWHRCSSEFISKVSFLLWPVWLTDSRRRNASQVPVSRVNEGLGIVLYVLQYCQLRKHIFKSCFILNQRRATVHSTLTSFNVPILPTPFQGFTLIRHGPRLIYLILSVYKWMSELRSLTSGLLCKSCALPCSEQYCSVRLSN